MAPEVRSAARMEFSPETPPRESEKGHYVATEVGERCEQFGRLSAYYLSLPKTPSERPDVVRAPHYIHLTRCHQPAVSPVQVTPNQVTPKQVT